LLILYENTSYKENNITNLKDKNLYIYISIIIYSTKYNVSFIDAK